jgi:Uma2 family endonuclease
MAILEHDVRTAGQSSLTGLHRHLFTREEYYAIGTMGLFTDKRIELIEGEIIEMAPIGPPHAAITHPLAVILEQAFGTGFTARNQVPVVLEDDIKPSEPEPDIAVVTGHWRDYLNRKPGTSDIKLIVEVADSSLNDDRTIKAVLYATFGIPEYWIVNLIDLQLEVYREPSETGYASCQIYRSGDTVTPLSAPNASVVIADFMP